jgi:GT2 family glycosyltransferase
VEKVNLEKGNMRLSIVIVSWNTRELLSACIETIRHQAGFQHPELIETIVVDNCSTDGTVEALKQKYPEVIVIENVDNVGFARATNQGVMQASGVNILLLNPDTELGEYTLSILIQTLKETPTAGAVGARLVSPNGRMQESAYPRIGLFREFWRLFHLDSLRQFAQYPLERWPQDRPHRVEVVQGACLLLRRKALDDVGLLDEDYFMYTEEVDLCYRLMLEGWEILWEPRAVVIHYGGQSTQHRKTEMFIKLYESKILFFRKHHGRLSARVYKGLLLLASLPRVFLSGAGGLTGIGHQQEQRERALNYLQLLRRLPSL